MKERRVKGRDGGKIPHALRPIAIIHLNQQCSIMPTQDKEIVRDIRKRQKAEGKGYGSFL